jgi:hypothetical protein
MPNLGGDLLIPLLMMVLSPHVAGKVFLTASVLVFWMGAALYVRQIARTGPGVPPAALLLLPFVIEGSFCWGFLNYYSGIGLAFLTLVHQDRIIRKRTIPRFESALHAAFVSALFVWHLAVWVIYGSLAACRIAFEVYHGLGASWQERGGFLKSLSRPAAVAAAIIPSILLFFLYEAGASGASAVDLGFLGRIESSILLKKVCLFGSLIGVYDWRMGLLVIFLWASAGFCWFNPLLAPSLKCDPLPVLGLGLLMLLFIVIPDRMGSVSAADARLVPAIFVCLLALAAGRPLGRPRLGTFFLVLCISVKFADTYRAWERLGSRLDRYAEAFPLMAKNSSLLPINVPRGVTSREQPETHFHCWAVIERDANDPTLFAHAGQSPLRLSLPEFCSASVDLTSLGPVDLNTCYDYLWLMNRDGRALDVPPRFEPLLNRNALSLYKIRR